MPAGTAFDNNSVHARALAWLLLVSSYHNSQVKTRMKSQTTTPADPNRSAMRCKGTVIVIYVQFCTGGPAAVALDTVDSLELEALGL